MVCDHEKSLKFTTYCHYLQKQFIYYAGSGTEPMTSYTVVQTGLEI